jgi:4-amino-4-deoxy-L-arabinose transferase-like glycosyltransferase
VTSVLQLGARRYWEFAVLLGIGVIAAWLRLRDLDLVEFKSDEATAVDLARRVLEGDFPTVGLISSIGAHNPPLFVYLAAVPLAVRDDPLAATAFVALLTVVSVVVTYVALRPRFGALVALGSAALFATSPWAVLYARKLWGQSVLPLVAVLLLWSLFAVLERARSRAVVAIPILLCLAFQLNFSALALAVPAAVLLVYRVRDVHWRAFAVGVAVAALLLAPWLYHQVASGFDDVDTLLRGDTAESAGVPEPGAAEAVRQTLDLVGVGDWEYVAADSLPSFVTDVGSVWDAARAASLVITALFALGLVTCALCVVRGARRRPLVELITSGAAARALMLVWLAGVCLVYATPMTDRLFPHYLLVTFPVSFAVAAIGLTDLAACLARWLGNAAVVGAVATILLVAGSYTAFTLSFQRFLGSSGGTAGDYGVVYRDKRDLAGVVAERGLRIANEPVLDFLVTGDARIARGDPPFVIVTDRLHNATPPCDGELRSFGVLDACLPRG